MVIDPMLALAGGATGLLVGTTGVGGGALMTPLLLLVFGVAPTAAIGTDLWFAAITKLAATRFHHSKGLIDWEVVKRLWMGGLPASAATSAWIAYAPVDASMASFLRMVIAWAVIVTAAAMLFQAQLHALGKRLRLQQVESFKHWQPVGTVAAGALLGFLVTLTSIGAGALGVVFLAYLYPLRLTASRLVATDLVHAIPLAMFAGFGHLLIGNVNFGLLGNLLIGSIPGVLVGAWLSSRLPHGLLRKALSVVLLATGVKLLQSLH